MSHSLVEHAVMSILIDYLTDIWKKQHLPKAVAIINLQDGVTTVLAVVLAHVADSCIGHFKMVVFTTVAYILVKSMIEIIDILYLPMKFEKKSRSRLLFSKVKVYI